MANALFPSVVNVFMSFRTPAETSSLLSNRFFEACANSPYFQKLKSFWKLMTCAGLSSLPFASVICGEVLLKRLVL
ncbi:hypothetical protein D3C85_1319020 [compost metagenome]